jgi:hypothetical protein
LQVPVVKIEGSNEFLADSDAIIDHLRAIVSKSGVVVPIDDVDVVFAAC